MKINQLKITFNNITPITISVSNIRHYNKIFQCTATDETGQIQIKAFDFTAKKFADAFKVSFLNFSNYTFS